MPNDPRAILEQRIAALAIADPQVRAAMPSQEVVSALGQPDLSPAQIAEIVLAAYADRPALAHRVGEITTDPRTGRRTRRLLPQFVALSYAEVAARVDAVAAACRATAPLAVAPGDVVCIVGSPGIDFTTLDLACARVGATVVPLHSDVSSDLLAAIVTETEPTMLAVATDELCVAVESLRHSPAPRHLICFDYHAEDDDHRDAIDAARSTFAACGINVVIETLPELLDRGALLPPPPPVAVSLDATAILLYTSGSTGAPKGVIYTAKTAAAMWAAKGEIPSLTVHFMPLSHLAGRNALFSTLAEGGTVHFTGQSDMSTLLEDIALVRPTRLRLVPRVCETLHQRYHGDVTRRIAEGSKRADAEANARVVFRRELLGGRVVWALCGTAPLPTELREFVESVLELKLHDAYGSTEAGAILADGRLMRPPILDYKLADVPELGYFCTDQPYPRGELLLRSQTLTTGYFRRPEATAAAFDEEGYYRTGDIVAEIETDRLQLIDRRSSILKLAHGEFVAVSRLESTFGAAPAIRQIFIYGSSERSYLLAVVVPTDPTRSKLDLLQSIRETARSAGLNAYEIPRDILIEHEPFSVGNGLLSGVGKLLRPMLHRTYSERLEQLYREQTERREQELSALRAGRDESALGTVYQAVAAVLGCPTTDLRPDVHFAELGGDSLAAVSFAGLLAETFDIDIQAATVTNPVHTLWRLAEHIECLRIGTRRRPTCSSVHEDPTAKLHAHELTLEKFFDPMALPVPDRPRIAAAPTVLLTGANGFLGRFLCLEWLRKLADSGGRLICLVRGVDRADARARLEAPFGNVDPRLARDFRALADRLEVVAGDIAEPNLGLSEDDWQKLSENVDVIVHAAAAVNHLHGYGPLFGPNVAGTAEIIRLALTTRLKPVDFISSVAVAAGSDTPPITEDDDLRSVLPTRMVSQEYANGYGSSKWAAEVLLREAHDRYGLPVTVFRSGMMLAHRHYTGQLNNDDTFTRLLFSVIATGVAPKSFYRANEQGERQRAHYDGLPVDFVASSITELGARQQCGYRTFHVVNPHDDGVSLDTLVDHLAASGHAVRQVDDYDEWFTRFGIALRSLPVAGRQQSILPLLHSLHQPAPAQCGSAVSADQFRTAVRVAAPGGSPDIPHLPEGLIDTYLENFRSHGII
ncbi:fatty acid CoA ligase FadD9 [Rhodococcus sp. AG1013]|uniref:carboxylic acid reductase n=1 Tax=Rhodococcus sp. AG1013 TaxID=2183996 RepID=UPI000E0B733D|nr:carboxylic acid reductase [Rhodococcus sp. AG1013]RDI17665.1 fatty acid CoA ligase FadD9 [Rhodococcus sp. AG1013]